VPPFDAVLVIAFGGPQGPADVRPFLENVLRGRRVTPSRVDEVAHHYERFGGVSPLTELTLRQADGLRTKLRDRGHALPVHVGMRNWHPYLADALAEMSRQGVRRAVGVIAAAHRSYSSCRQYRENVDAARAELATRGMPDVEVCYVADWHTRPGFIDASADHVRDALDRLPAGVRDEARIVFTAHSIPLSMAEQYPYREQIEASARLVMARLDAARPKSRPAGGVAAAGTGAAVGRDFSPADDGARGVSPASSPGYAIVYQSRSGRPEDPWLGPDVCDYLRAERARGLAAAVLAPIGFICDHIEVLYDLDVEAAGVCREVGLPMVRATAVNDHPRFLDALADAVVETCRRYDRARPLQVVARS
jgi:protoporphyrin/coproporphyrin ferrochelatase